MARPPLARLLSPRSIAVIGGREAQEVIRQCDLIGFSGSIYPVNPKRREMLGHAVFRSIADLPEAPDASFIALPREATLEAVSALAARGAGGAVCYASGFAEDGAEGAALERELVARSGAMALAGPNCYGLINYLDGAALWPDQHGGKRVARGVAILTQSGNIGLNLTLQKRSLPIAYLVTVGNKAKGDIGDYVDAFLDDPRVSAIGLHIEGLKDIAGFERAAARARVSNIPVIVIKTGRSSAGAQITLSHTSSLAGSDAVYNSFFERCGVVRANDLAVFLETLKLLHVFGPLPGRRISSMSCSGGEASLIADLAGDHGLTTPAPDAGTQAALAAALGPKVAIGNPLDYHTYIWGDLGAQTKCFAAMLGGGHDINLLMLDFPRVGAGDISGWDIARQALGAAQTQTGARAAVLASLPESLPEEIGEALIAKGIAPMQGLSECLAAIALAARAGELRARAPAAPLAFTQQSPLPYHILDEAEAKAALSKFGLVCPPHRIAPLDKVGEAAAALGFPVVVKALSADIAHKSELGAVRLNLASREGAAQAAQAMSHLSSRFLVETMQTGAIAELIIGVKSDPPFGLALTIGAGGIFVDLLRDSATLLLPATRADYARALDRLAIGKVLRGYRGRPAADIEAVLDAIEATARYALANKAGLVELDVNPLLAMAKGHGAIAVDALIVLGAANTDGPA